MAATAPVPAPTPTAHPVTLTVEQTAVLFDIGRSGAYRAVNRGDIPSIRIGGRIRVPTAKVLELLDLSELPGWFVEQLS